MKLRSTEREGGSGVQNVIGGSQSMWRSTEKGLLLLFMHTACVPIRV
jgi:hypothetical protein